MKVFRNFLSILIVIALIFVELYAIAIYNVEKFVTEETIQEAMSKISLSTTLKDTAPVNETVNQVVTGIYDIAEKANVPDETMDALIDSKTVKNLSGTYLSNVAKYFMTGEEIEITGEEVKSLVKENIDEIIIESNGKIAPELKDQVLNAVENKADEIALLIPKPSSYASSIDTNEFKSIQTFFAPKSENLLYITIGVGIVLLVLIQFSFYKWLPWSGSANIITGAFTCLLSGSIIDILIRTYAANNLFVIDVLQSFSKVLSNQFFIFGGILLGIGIVQIMVYFAIKRKLHEEHVGDIIKNLKEQKESI